MRADAEVDEGVLVLDRVAGDVGLTFGLLVDQLHLQRLAARREERLRLLARPHLPLVDEILRGELLHLRFDRLEVLGHERARDDEVVEEAFVGGRADAALHAGKETGDRRREQMRRAVAIQRQRLRAPVGHDPDGRVTFERIRQIDQLAVDDPGERRLGEARRDPFRHVADGRAGRHTATRTIGKGDGDLTHSGIAKSVVGTGGLEPPTSCVSSRRSNL